MKGCALGSGFAPIFTGQRPYQAPSPILFQSVPGEAKPRRTSGGKAGKKVLLGQSFATVSAGDGPWGIAIVGF
ncbi:MAG TPA: hypothetical protein VFS77_20905 [Pyrinomonadaceae bacterium]|nr:hypothetical protein [Pyrinomonadaceae bacterium]